jgi:hypothetical protein
MAAINIGLLPPPPWSFCSRKGFLHEKYHDIEIFLQGKNLEPVSLKAGNFDHHKLVCYGLRIGLFPSAFLDYLEHV